MWAAVGHIWGMAHGPNEHVEWALQNVTETSTADSTTYRAVSWGPYGAPRAVVAAETRIQGGPTLNNHYSPTPNI